MFQSSSRGPMPCLLLLTDAPRESLCPEPVIDAATDPTDKPVVRTLADAAEETVKNERISFVATVIDAVAQVSGLNVVAVGLGGGHDAGSLQLLFDACNSSSWGLGGY